MRLAWVKYVMAALIMMPGMTQGWGAEALTWEDCLKEASKNHPDLIAAYEGIVQQQDNKIITGSARFPQVTADLNASTTRLNATSSNKFGYGASVSQLLFDGFKTSNNVKAAAENIKTARANFKFTSTEIRLRLREAFINLLKAQQLLKLTQEIHQLRINNLDLITLRYQSGTEHKGALLTAQANVSKAVFEINQAKRGLEAAQRQLIKEIGRKAFSPIVADGSFDVRDTVFNKPDFEALALKNPSVLKAASQVNAAAMDIQARQGDFWPAVALTAGADKTGTRWPPDSRSTTAGVKVSLPLLDGGERFAQLDKSKSAYRQLIQQLRSTTDAVALDLEKSWNDMQDAVENVKVQDDFYHAAIERAKISEQQYSVGLISFDNWTIIEDDLVKNKKSMLDAQTNALLSRARWVQAKGEALEYEK